MRRILFSISLLAGSALGVAGFAAGSAHADTLPISGGHFEVTAPAPDMSMFQDVIDADTMVDLEKITERLDAHLYVDADGTVKLPDHLTAEVLDVEPEFLANFRAALEYSNELILDGQIVVGDDLTVSAGETFEWPGAEPGLIPGPGPGTVVDGAPGASTGGDELDWNAYRYSSGCMFYNSYSTYSRYSRSYYGLCSTMAAYIGYPHISPSLVSFYTYNSSYMGSSCYNPTGMYYYLPYTSGCRSYIGGAYAPCYSSLGYKPAYFWTRSYGYSSGCGCYTYNWAWHGYWARY